MKYKKIIQFFMVVSSVLPMSTTLSKVDAGANMVREVETILKKPSISGTDITRAKSLIRNLVRSTNEKDKQRGSNLDLRFQLKLCKQDCTIAQKSEASDKSDPIKEKKVDVGVRKKGPAPELPKDECNQYKRQIIRLKMAANAMLGNYAGVWTTYHRSSYHYIKPILDDKDWASKDNDDAYNVIKGIHSAGAHALPYPLTEAEKELGLSKYGESEPIERRVADDLELYPHVPELLMAAIGKENYDAILAIAKKMQQESKKEIEEHNKNEAIQAVTLDKFPENSPLREQCEKRSEEQLKQLKQENEELTKERNKYKSDLEQKAKEYEALEDQVVRNTDYMRKLLADEEVKELIKQKRENLDVSMPQEGYVSRVWKSLFQ